MEKQNTTPEYEAPYIKDHGDLTELTAATGKNGVFDASFKAGEHIPPAYGTSP